MKLLLKLLLLLCVLIIGIFITTPLWMPPVLSMQLPAGYQLESIEFKYPGFSNVHIESLRLTGQPPALDIVISASDIDVNYKEWKTSIGSMVVDIDLRRGESPIADVLSIDDLSLPIIVPAAYPPEFYLRELRVNVHHDMNFTAANIKADEPLVLNFQAIKLLRQANDIYHLSAGISLDSSADPIGLVSIDANATSRNARLRFPVSANTPPWLSLSIEQADLAAKTTSLISGFFDAGATNPKWMSTTLRQTSNGLLKHLEGTLGMEAKFAGDDLQRIEYLELTPRKLRAWSGESSLSLDARLLARRDEALVSVALTEPATIRVEDHDGWIDDLFATTIPGLHLRRNGVAFAQAELGDNGNFIIDTESDFSSSYTGGFGLDISSADRHLEISATDMKINAADFSGVESINTEGLVKFNWQEKDTFTYTTDGLDLKADAMSVSGDIVSTHGTFISKGKGTVTGGLIKSMDTSATSIEMSWHHLNLLTLNGELSAKTSGFSTGFNDETWSGFDFDMDFSLSGNSAVQGAGLVLIDRGPELPIEVKGNTAVQHWNIILPSNFFNLGQLGSLLSVAHLQLPEAIDLADGRIGLQGYILLKDDMHASALIEGDKLSGSFYESSAHNATFSLDTSYDDAVHATGPVSIETIKLAGGLEVSRVEANLNIESTQTITLHDLSADLLDGQLKLNTLRFSDNKIDDTTIALHHISLARLLAFLDIDGLEGTGFLTFLLPAGSDQSGIHIQDGSFASLGPGSLIYKKEGFAANNIGLQALENFRYKDLSGTINYQADGSYRIGIHLEGNNPDLYGGHAIDFNLNISGSLPEMFEALFMTGSFEESILKQIGIE